MAEPFMDRGVRKLAGENLYIASWETAKDYVKGQGDIISGSRLTWVWNTGR